jgi:hypothetical protein
MEIIDTFEPVECIKCNKPVSIHLLQMNGGGLLWKGECEWCHLRVWKHIFPAERRKLSVIELADRVKTLNRDIITLSGRLKCPVCQEFCKSVKLNRGQLMCEMCIKITGGAA